MNRREFLLLAGGGIGGWGLPPLVGPAVRPTDLCRAPSPAIRPAGATGDGVLVYQGTHILTYGALRELADRFSTATGRRMVVHGGGCDDGISAVAAGSADLGGLCCPAEGSRAETLHALLVARDIKAVVAHPSNPLAALSLDSLRAAAAGRLTRWSDLGGENKPIALVVRDHCPEYREPVRTLLLGNRPVWSQHRLNVGTDQQLVDTVVRFPGAIGIVSWVFAQPLVADGRLKVLAVGEAPPTAEAARSGAYPLVGPLSLIYRRWRDDVMRPFFDFLYGPEGQATIGERLLPVEAAEAGYGPGVRL